MLKVNLQVKIKGAMSKPFQTDSGAPQGYAKSAIEFLLYLANTVREFTDHREKEHDYVVKHKSIKPNHLANHTYCRDTQIN